jgi:hypothetical protein
MNKERPTPPRAERLDARYRDIGIPAVAAAVRYKTDTRNPAYAPVELDGAAQAKIAEQEGS